MKKIMSWLQKLSRTNSVIALQDACISLLPLVIAMALILLIGHCLQALPSVWFTSTLITPIFDLLEFFYLIFPLLFTVSLSLSFAKSHNVDPIIIIVLSVSLLLIAAFSQVDSIDALKHAIYYKILPIPICYLTVKLFAYLSLQKRLLVYKTGEFGIGLRSNMNAVIPSIITFVCVLLFLWLLRSADAFFSISEALHGIKAADIDNPFSLIVTEAAFKLTWFVGINPNHVYQFLDDSFYVAFLQNQEAFLNGAEIPHIVVEGFHIYSDIGGAGGVLCLLMAIFYVSKSQHKLNIAKLSVIPCSFNISEVIHYGIPIIFNPFLLLPFLLVPITLSLLSYGVMWVGWVQPIVEPVPWITPPLINAYLASGGDVNAVLLQVLNFTIGTLIYIQFIKLSESSPISERVVERLSNKLKLYSKNIQAIQYRNQQSILKSIETERLISKTFREITEGELLLYYQPIVDLKSKEIVKLEALMRLKNKQGYVKGPFFIETLSKAGLSADFDRWVVERVTEQSQQWPVLDRVGISINVSPTSLLDAAFIEFLVGHKKMIRHPLTIEVLENEIIFEEETVNQHLQILRSHGLKIWLDDFGSGYSALSLLSKISVDGVKYYLEFSEQLDAPRGYDLLEACLQVSKTLKHKTVLEGVETRSQLQAALSLDLDMVQGYIITRPIPAEEVPSLLVEFNTASFDQRLHKV